MLKKLNKALSRILGRSAASRGRQKPRRFMPELEHLQNRLVPATLTNGNLYIFGTNAADVVNVTYDSGFIKVTENGHIQSFSLASITGRQIWFMGYGGNDFYNAVNTSGVASIVYAGDGNDTVYGGEGHDAVVGEKGNDYLYGGLGNDKLYGAFFGSGSEVGKDHLYGGSGVDELWGGDGDDVLVGQNGGDVIFGEKGNDKMYGDFAG